MASRHDKIRRSPQRRVTVDDHSELVSEDESAPEKYSPEVNAPVRLAAADSGLNPNSRVNSANTNMAAWLPYIILVVFCAIFLKFCFGDAWNAPKCKFALDDELDKLKPQFRFIDEEAWILLSAGIEKIKNYEPHRPSTFIFIHRNMTTAERLARATGSLASQFLSDCSNKQAILLNGAHIGENLIERYRHDLYRSHVMVILGLERMSAETASPFHSLCDEYNPVVGNSAFFFTLQVDQSTRGESAGKMAKKRLLDLWKNSPDELVSGLVTRLAHNVIKLDEEEINARIA